MGRKRVKATDMDIYGLESHYYDFYRVKNKDGERGIAFVFDKLSNNDIITLGNFKNVIISKGTYIFAPEIKNCRVIILDKCLKEG